MDRTPRVSVTTRGQVGVLVITGDLTDSLDALLLPAYEEATQRGSKQLLLIFQPTSFVNSAALRSILSLVLRASDAGRSVRFCGFSPHMRHVFELVGLHHYVGLFSSEAEALADWDRPLKRRSKPG